jgi:hypothetical protein
MIDAGKPVMPLALISASRRSIVSFGPKLLSTMANPSAVIAGTSSSQIPAVIATNLLVAK